MLGSEPLIDPPGDTGDTTWVLCSETVGTASWEHGHTRLDMLGALGI